MFKNIFLLFLFFSSGFLGIMAQNEFSLSAIELCKSYDSQHISMKPVGMENVDFDINNFDTIPVTQDDHHSALYNLGFTFNFYGVNYTQAFIGSNGYLGFDVAKAGDNFTQWGINSDIPNGVNIDAQNSIMAPYTDSEPGINTTVVIGTAGSPGDRIFLVLWRDLEMFGFQCNSGCFSGGIVIFEGSNKIMTSIPFYESCSGWNNGAGVHGLYKDATTALIVDDPVTGQPRNFSDPWNAYNETVIFTPNSAGTNYTYAFNPIFSNFAQPIWYDSLGVEFAQGFNIEYVGPHLDQLPSFVTIKAVQCGDSIEVDLPVVMKCPEFDYFVKGESCTGFSNGEINFFIDDSCGYRVDEWHFDLIDVNGVVVQSKIDSVFPIKFENLERGVYNMAYFSPDRPRCIDTLEVLVPYENAKPQVHAVISDPLCHDESSGIIEFNPHGGFNTDWNVNVYNSDGNLVATYNSNSIPINIVNLGEGTYDVVVVSPSTCEDTIEYTLNNPPLLRFSSENYEHNNCGVVTSFIDFPVTGGTPPYTYEINGESAIDLNREPMPVDVHTLVARDANGCELIREVDIQDRFAPKVDFIMPIEVNLADATINFQDLTITNPNTKPQYWLWEFGDTDVSYEKNPTHTYTEIGVYRVFLFVTDETGCQGFLEKEINVISPSFFLPTAFTPNGDGNNEIFKPVIGRISNEDFHMRISDRWGRSIFSTNNIHEGWDGRDKNGNIQTGSYIWIADYKDEFGYEKHVNGIVQLIN